MEQKSMRRRLYICIPMFLVAISLLLYSLRDKDGFDMIWRYFAWANQTLSVFTLWAITAPSQSFVMASTMIEAFVSPIPFSWKK